MHPTMQYDNPNTAICLLLCFPTGKKHEREKLKKKNPKPKSNSFNSKPSWGRDSQ